MWQDISLFRVQSFIHLAFDTEKDLLLSSLRKILYTANLIVQLLVEEWKASYICNEFLQVPSFSFPRAWFITVTG